MEHRIIHFRYENLRNEAHVEYHDAVKTLFVTYPPAMLNVVAQYNVYQAAYTEEVEALDIIRRSELTAEIEEEDKKRDTIFRGLVDLVTGATHHFDPNKRTAALRILNVINHYGNIARKRLDEETAAIDDLYRELQTGEFPAYLSQLGLTEWTDELDGHNRRFKELMQDRYYEAAERPTVRMKAARKVTDETFRALLNQVEALVLVQGEAAYLPFIHALNAISERYKNIMAQEAGERTKN
jgi:hypothetical protein